MASPVDTSVKFYNEKMPGAPTLNTSAGSGIDVLKTCLVTGFGSRTAVSLVVASGVATMTLASDALNPNLKNSVIEVAGSSITDLNGEQRVVNATTTTLTFATEAADGTASGTITVKTAGAGWEEVYTDTNVSVLRSTDLTSGRRYMRIGDNQVNEMRITGYETMSDANTGTGAFPTAAQSSTGLKFYKASNSASPSTAATRWDLFADKSFMIWAPLMYFAYSSGSYTGQQITAFGDILPASSADLFATMNVGSTAGYGGLGDNDPGLFGPTSPSTSTTSGNGGFLPRGYAGSGTALRDFFFPEAGNEGEASGKDTRFGSGPSSVDGKLQLTRIAIAENGPSIRDYRGTVPGAVYIPHKNVGGAIKRGDILSPTSGLLAGRKLYAVQPGFGWSDGDSDTTAPRGFVDITGPWR